MTICTLYVSKIALSIIFLFVLCEYLIYYIVIVQCQWPILDPKSADPNIILKDEVEPVQVMLLADTHLLGSRNGHWFDKLRREWQMRRSFQTAVQLLKPEVIFILGDLFDEGLWCSSEEFQYYVKRFHTLFSVPDHIKMYVVAGNHDIGFHYGISPFLMERFTVAFDAPAVKLITIKGNHFVLVNSMAMEGDGCFLCRPAELQINNIDVRLKCTKGIGHCKKNMHLGQYSRPILLQHYPLFRESDGLRCDDEGADNAPEAERTVLHRERWDCLSRDATNSLLETLNPRLSIGGHTHHSCHRIHVTRTSQITEEFSISSFSWRNKNNPIFLLATITPNNYSVHKCHLPEESTVFCLYIIGSMAIFVYFGLLYKKMYKIGPCRAFKPFKRL